MTAKFELFFDESGTFEEPSLFDGDKTNKGDKRASQVVGLLARTGKFTREKAKSILNESFQSAGMRYSGAIHATDLRSSEQFNLLVEKLLEIIIKEDLKIVRIVNKERIGYGGNLETYTNITAHFVIRIFSELSKEYKDNLSLSIYPASRVIPTEQEGVYDSINTADYKMRLAEHMSNTAVRLGRASDLRRWKIEKLKTMSARRDPQLQICDILSNASFNNFKKLRADVKKKMLSASGNYNFTLFLSNLEEEIAAFIDSGAYASALQLIVETVISLTAGKTEKNTATLALKDCLSALKELSAPARNAQFMQIDSWIRQMLEVRNKLNFVTETIKWMETNIVSVLSENLTNPDLEWFSFALDLHALTAYNHLGDIIKSAEYCRKLDEKLIPLAGQWEYAPLMLEALIHQAVHLTDSFKFTEASSKMKAVADYYESLSDLFHDALPEYFPTTVKSRIRGMALGTYLQSELFAGLQFPERFENARRISDEAINEFILEDDKKRQFQYRAQLEAFAGNFQEAAKYLAMSINSEKSDFESLLKKISELTGFSQGFALLHCCRIASEAARKGDRETVALFYTSLKKYKLYDCEWARAITHYPSHGIVRALALISSYMEDEQKALTFLNILAEALNEKNMNSFFRIIILCGWSESLVFLCRLRPLKIEKIIKRRNTSLLKELKSLIIALDWIPAQKKVVEDLYRAVDSFISSDFKDPQEVIKTARIVGY